MENCLPEHAHWRCAKLVKWYDFCRNKQQILCGSYRGPAGEALCFPFGLTFWKSGEGEAAQGGREICLSLCRSWKGTCTHTRTHTSNIFVIPLSSVNHTQSEGPPPQVWRHIRGQCSPIVITAAWSKISSQRDLSANYPDKKGREA